MISEIKSLAVKNNPFFDNATLDIIKNGQVSVIYGKNGSGKTTISNCIVDCINGNSDVSFLDENGNVISLSDEEKKHVFVFNESYIDKQVRVASQGIDAIVLFGEAAEIDDEIENNKSKIKSENDLITSRDVEKYHRIGGLFCVDDAYNSMETSLRNTWAQRRLDIRGGVKRSPVTESVVNTIVDVSIIGKNRRESENRFRSLLEIVKKANSSNSVVSAIKIPDSMFDDDSTVELLNKRYDKKEYSNIANQIIKATERFGRQELTDVIISNKLGYCPVCMNNLDLSYLDSLEKAINEVYDETISNAERELDTLAPAQLQVDWNGYIDILPKDMINSISLLISKYNTIVEQYFRLIEQKKRIIYEPLNVSSLNLCDIERDLHSVLISANEIINEHNTVVQNYEKSIKELYELNDIIAAFEIEAEKKKYLSLLDSEKRDKLDNNKSIEKIEQYKKDIQALNAKKKNIEIAMKEINAELACIFSSGKRMKLVSDRSGMKYYITVNGKNIPTEKLSTGERNLIALLYFFEEMRKECEKNKYYRDPLFIVVDDPISSFDFENKMGVYSYLKKVFQSIFDGNKSSKLLVMSHERDVVFSIVRIFDSFYLKDGSKVGKACNKLDNKQITNLRIKTDSDYTFLLKEVFDFASITKIDESFVSKGNDVRKMIEYYSTFNYGRGMDDFLTDQVILDEISDNDLKEYFRTRMFSLALNSSSHGEFQALQYPNFDSFDSFSEFEQVRIAREIICYIFLVHPAHIIRLLNDANKIATIEKWIQDMKSEITSASA